MYKKLKKFLKTNSHTKELYVNMSRLKANYLNSKKNKYVQKNGLFLMRKLSNTLDLLEISWFFDFGTLLGVVRENQLLGHDLDIDVGVIISPEIQKKVKLALTNSGFQLCYEYILEEKVVEESYLFNNIKMDINYYVNNNKNSYCYLFYRDPDKEYEADDLDVVKLSFSLIDKTILKDFHGIDIRIPVNAEQFLEEKYGKTWRIPDKNWKYWKGPCAQKIDKIGRCIKHKTS